MKKPAAESGGAHGKNYTCKECGSHELFVEHFFTAYAGAHWVEFLEKGDLNIDTADDAAHTVEEWSEAEEVETGSDEELNAPGEDGEDDDEKEEEEEELEVDDDSHAYFVRCKGCEREIEFGWTRPGGEDRIWPVECRDFDAKKCWPDARYQDAWAKKGWLRTSGSS
jgi:hypothetical protein